MLAFSPTGVLFAADPRAAAIYALELDNSPGAKAGAADVSAIDQKIAALLGTDAASVAVKDLVIHPVTKREDRVDDWHRADGSAGRAAFDRARADRLGTQSRRGALAASYQLPASGDRLRPGAGGWQQNLRDAIPSRNVPGHHRRGSFGRVRTGASDRPRHPPRHLQPSAAGSGSHRPASTRPRRAGESRPGEDAGSLGKSDFTKSFRVGPAIERPPDPAEWRIVATPAATRDPLRISFPAALDRALLERGLSVARAGAAVPGEWRIEAGEARSLFVPSEPWQPGEHAIVVLPILEDVSGNRIGRAFEVLSPGEAVPPESSQSTSVPFRIAAGC